MLLLCGSCPPDHPLPREHNREDASMAVDCVGAIDQGTQSTRFVIYSAKGEVVAMHQEEFPQHNPHAGCALFMAGIDMCRLRALDHGFGKD